MGMNTGSADADSSRPSQLSEHGKWPALRKNSFTVLVLGRKRRGTAASISRTFDICFALTQPRFTRK